MGNKDQSVRSIPPAEARAGPRVPDSSYAPDDPMHGRWYSRWQVWLVVGVLALSLTLGPLLVLGQDAGERLGWTALYPSSQLPARTRLPTSSPLAQGPDAVTELAPLPSPGGPTSRALLAKPTATAAPSPSATPTEAPPFTLEPRALGYDAATVVTDLADVWKDPVGTGNPMNLETQLNAGERVVIVAESGDWYQIVAVEQPSSRDELGYPGWVLKSALVPGWAIARQYAVVMAKLAEVKVSPDEASATVMQIHLDTRLPVLSESDDWVQVRLPDGRAGWLARSEARLAADPNVPAETDRILETATQLVDMPYRWGGTSSRECDCSGFIYRVFHAHGITIGRDSWDQDSAGRLVVSTEVQPGDLLFFATAADQPATHVAVYVGDGRVLDCGNGISVAYHSLGELFSGGVWKDTRTYVR